MLSYGSNASSACYPETTHIQRSDVAINILAMPTCTGTLVRGPGGRLFIFTARHCAGAMHELALVPPTAYSVLFEYKLPVCNASTAEPRTYKRFLQVGYVVFVGTRAPGVSKGTP